MGNSFLLFYRPTKAGLKPSRLWISARTQSSKPAPTLIASSLLNNFSTEGSIETLIQATPNEQDPAARLDALTQIGSYAHEDSRVLSVLQQFAHTDPDLQVREAAEELLQNLE
jgi:HEAT repeat protein